MAEEPAGFPKPGDIFEERYRIESLIGSGGFAKVYLATQTDLGREVALKIMLPEEVLNNVLEDSSSNQGHNLAERFLQEARVVAKLRDPHTVTMHDHGRSKDRLLYMVFEYIDGVPLSRLIKAQGALEPRRVTKIIRQTLESLQEAHAMGMLHRDIKPGNIMIYEHVGRSDLVKVLDFGIAKVVGQKVKQDLREDLTTNGALLGTPRYMSPEQIRGQDLSAASDIYSLGLVAYEMLTGHKAIDSNSSVIVIGAQLDPRSFAVPNRQHIPARVRMIVNRMLEKERHLRYQNVDEVLEDLNRLDTGAFPAVELPLSGESGMYPAAIDMPDISDSLEPLEVKEIEDEQVRARRSRRFATLGIIAALFLVGIAGAVVIMKPWGGDEIVGATERPPDEAGSGGGELAEVAPLEEDDDEAQMDFDEPQEDGEVEVPTMTISTNPPDIEVFVDERPVGKSPATVDTDEVEFPVRIRASLAGQERVVVIDSAISKVDLDLSMFAAKENAEPRESTNRDSRRTNRIKKQKDGRKKDPKKVVESPEEDDDGPKLNLPAMDNF